MVQSVFAAFAAFVGLVAVVLFGTGVGVEVHAPTSARTTRATTTRTSEIVPLGSTPAPPCTVPITPTRGAVRPGLLQGSAPVGVDGRGERARDLLAELLRPRRAGGPVPL